MRLLPPCLSEEHYNIVLANMDLQRRLSAPSNEVSENANVENVNANAHAERHEMDLSNLAGKSFRKRHLIYEMNQWAGVRKFKMAYSEGQKKMKNGYKQTLACSVRECAFRMMFNSNHENEQYKINLSTI